LTLTATVSGLGFSQAFVATVTAGPAASASLNAGNNQSARVGTAVSTAPSVKVIDQYGNAVPGVSVTFTVTGGGGSVTPGSTTTNAAGVASTAWTMGS